MGSYAIQTLSGFCGVAKLAYRRDFSSTRLRLNLSRHRRFTTLRYLFGNILVHTSLKHSVALANASTRAAPAPCAWTLWRAGGRAEKRPRAWDYLSHGGQPYHSLCHCYHSIPFSRYYVCTSLHYLLQGRRLCYETVGIVCVRYLHTTTHRTHCTTGTSLPDGKTYA